MTKITLYVSADFNKLLNVFGQEKQKNGLDPTFMQCIFKDYHKKKKKKHGEEN